MRRKEAELERLRQRTMDIQAEQLLMKDKDFAAAQKQIADLRHRLWQVRLNIKRKSYSMRVRKKALEQLEASLAKFQEEEKKNIAHIEQIERKIAELQDKYKNQVGATT